MKTVKTQNSVNGILLLNKNQDITSNKALQKAKQLFPASKAGHTGSLDPLATGMLPICFGEATKICQFLLESDKCYETTGILGIKTDTSDSLGKVIAYSPTFSVPRAKLEKIIQKYEGVSKQIPSMYSALKQNGIPLYRLAREGIQVERPGRDIHIKELQLTHFDGLQFSLRIVCSKGTYIRNLVEDIGDDLEIGAHVSVLHRVYTGSFKHSSMYSLDDLAKMSLAERMKCLLPLDKAVEHIPKVDLNEDQIKTIREGRVLDKEIFTEQQPGLLRFYNQQSQFIGLGIKNEQGFIKAKRLLAFDSSVKSAVF